MVAVTVGLADAVEVGSGWFVGMLLKAPELVLSVLNMS